VLNTRHPSHGALESQPKTTVGNGAEAPHVEVPAVVFFFEPVLGNAVLEGLGILFALSATDNFAIAIRCNEITA